MKKISILALTASMFMSVAASANPYYPGQQTYSPYNQGNPYGQFGYRPAPQPAPPATPRINTDNMGPEEMLRVGVDAVQTFLGTDDVGNKQMALVFLREQVSGYFDFAYMAKWVAGRAWRSMDAAERQDLENNIKSKFLNTLATGIGGYADSQVNVLSARQGSKSEVVVPTTVTSRNGNMVRMEFRFYRSPVGWKIFDVKANGQSAVIFYRGHFQKMLRDRNQPQQTWG